MFFVYLVIHWVAHFNFILFPPATFMIVYVNISFGILSYFIQFWQNILIFSSEHCRHFYDIWSCHMHMGMNKVTLPFDFVS